MRAYLSSYRLGDHFEQFLALLPKNPKVLVIANALDVFSEAARQRYKEVVYDPYRELDRLGCSVTDLDLKQYFRRQPALSNRLLQSDFVWVLGGNSFVLRRAMHLSGFDAAITDHVEADRLAYGGFSAGAVVAAPNLKGIHLMDDPDVVPEGYQKNVSWDGLGWVDFAIVPHWKSEHPEAAVAEVAVKYLLENGLPHKTLSDGQAFLKVGSKLTLLS